MALRNGESQNSLHNKLDRLLKDWEFIGYGGKIAVIGIPEKLSDEQMQARRDNVAHANIEIGNISRRINSHLRADGRLEELIDERDQIWKDALSEDNSIMSTQLEQRKLDEKFAEIGGELSKTRGKWVKLSKMVEIGGQHNIDDYMFLIKRDGFWMKQVFMTQDTLDRIFEEGKYKNIAEVRRSWGGVETTSDEVRERFPVMSHNARFVGIVATNKKMINKTVVLYGEADTFYRGRIDGIRVVKMRDIQEVYDNEQEN